MEKKIGIDASVFIYLFEDKGVLGASAAKWLSRVEEGKVSGIFSALGLIEILTGPKKTDQNELVRQYKSYITKFPNLDIVGLNEDIVDLSSDLRATYSLTTPDAIHIASAICGGADAFVTNDKALMKVKEIAVTLLA